MKLDTRLYLNVVRMPANLVTLPPSSEAKKMTMKTKTWTVIANKGKTADLESGLEKAPVQKRPHISAREFVHWLAPDSHIDDDFSRSLFNEPSSELKQKRTERAATRRLAWGKEKIGIHTRFATEVIPLYSIYSHFSALRRLRADHSADVIVIFRKAT
jgi:hypothetical protein